MSWQCGRFLVCSQWAYMSISRAGPGPMSVGRWQLLWLLDKMEANHTSVLRSQGELPGLFNEEEEEAEA